MRMQLRHEFLQPTIENALRTPFYQALWSGIDTSAVTLETLHRLPLTTKQAIRHAGENARIRDGLVCDEFFTMGTSGEPLVTVRGNREQDFIRTFFENEIRAKPPRRRVRAVKFNDPYHGSHIAIPSDVHCHRISVFDTGSFAHGRLVLTGRHRDMNVESSCTLLIGGARCLKAFTDDTIRHHPQGFDTDLDYVVCLGEYVTKRWHELLAATWQAELIDRFSLSEIFGGATRSPLCGWWHFDPFVIPEVICTGTARSVLEGIGMLVLTALYPFQEAQPLVRYCTGDLVEVTHTRSSRPGELAIRPLGRAAYGVPDIEPGAWLLTPAAILEVVDALPEIERMPVFRDAPQVQDPFTIGTPRYTAAHRRDVGVVHIEIAMDVKPATSARRRDEIEEHVVEGLLHGNERLRSAARTHGVRFHVDFRRDLRPDQISCPA